MSTRLALIFCLMFAAGLTVAASRSCAAHGHSTWSLLLGTVALLVAFGAGKVRA